MCLLPFFGSPDGRKMINTLKQARAKLIGKRQEICEIIKKNLALHWIKQHQII